MCCCTRAQTAVDKAFQKDIAGDKQKGCCSAKLILSIIAVVGTLFLAIGALAVIAHYVHDAGALTKFFGQVRNITAQAATTLASSPDVLAIMVTAIGAGLAFTSITLLMNMTVCKKTLKQDKHDV